MSNHFELSMSKMKYAIALIFDWHCHFCFHLRCTQRSRLQDLMQVCKWSSVLWKTVFRFYVMVEVLIAKKLSQIVKQIIVIAIISEQNFVKHSVEADKNHEWKYKNDYCLNEVDYSSSQPYSWLNQKLHGHKPTMQHLSRDMARLSTVRANTTYLQPLIDDHWPAKRWDTHTQDKVFCWVVHAQFKHTLIMLLHRIILMTPSFLQLTDRNKLLHNIK